MSETVRETAIRDRLAASLNPQRVELLDESGLHIGHPGAKGGGHYRLMIVSDAFIGKPRVARHRLVYDALQPLMQSEIHALALTTLTQDECADKPDH
jgi:BolA family transcriptional regulator, general stress-responsive regulator